MSKKGIRKTIIATSLLLLTTFSTNSQSALWCGYPVCPGDVTHDELKIGFFENLGEIVQSYIEEQMVPALLKQMEQQYTLFGKRAGIDFNRSSMQTGDKTDAMKDIYNAKTLADLAPNPEQACLMLTWQDYLKTNTTEIASKKLSSNAAKVGRNSITGSGMSSREKDLSLYERLVNRNKNVDQIPSIGSVVEHNTLNKDDANNTLLAIDILTHTEGNNVTLTNTESQPYKRAFVTSARKVLVLNYMRQILSNPVYERIGASNANQENSTNPEGVAPNTESDKETYIDDFIKESNSTSEELQEKRNNESISGLDDFASSPVKYTRISSPFSPTRNHPVLGITRPHKGVDLAAPSGTPIYAPADGNFLKVGIDSAGLNNGFGRMIIISHKNNIQTWYGHLSGFSEGISTGKNVKKGDLIGYVGSTGVSSGNHLHYEIRVDGEPIDPMGRFGISQTEATQNLVDNALGENTFNSSKYRSTGEEMADGQTLPSQFLRKRLIANGLRLEKEWSKYKELERMKVTMAIKILNKLND